MVILKGAFINHPLPSTHPTDFTADVNRRMSFTDDVKRQNAKDAARLRDTEANRKEAYSCVAAAAAAAKRDLVRSLARKKNSGGAGGGEERTVYAGHHYLAAQF